MTTTTYILIATIIILLLLHYVTFRFMLHALRNSQRLCEERRLVGEEWEAVATERTSTAHDYVNAAKLISIKHNSKECTNYFTFARGDQFYTIETYGQMSDDIPLWRKQLGLSDGQ